MNNNNNIINSIPSKDSPILYQDKTRKDYEDFLKFDINEPLKKYDFFYSYYTKYIYYIYDIDDTKYYVINLINNKPEIFNYPFNYLKFNGYEPNIIKNIYHTMCKKMK